MGQPGGLQASERPIPGRELVRWPLLAWLLPLLPLSLLIASALQPERRLTLQLQPDQPLSSDNFRLEAGSWGAPQLDLQLSLPPNSSAILDLDLLDGAERVQLQLSKEAWRELSSWQAEGESGVDDSSDADVSLVLRPRQSGFFRLRLELRELLDARGVPRSGSLPALLRVRNHAVDRPLMLATTLVSALLVALALRAYAEQGQRRFLVRREDRHLDLRQVLGAGGLVRLSVRARYECGPWQALQGVPELELLVCDAQGRRVLRRRLPLQASRHQNDGDHWWIVEARLQLRFAQAASRRLRVVLPQQLSGTRTTLEWAQMGVLDGARLLWPAAVIDCPEPTTLSG